MHPLMHLTQKHLNCSQSKCFVKIFPNIPKRRFSGYHYTSQIPSGKEEVPFLPDVHTLLFPEAPAFRGSLPRSEIPDGLHPVPEAEVNSSLQGSLKAGSSSAEDSGKSTVLHQICFPYTWYPLRSQRPPVQITDPLRSVLSQAVSNCQSSNWSSI